MLRRPRPYEPRCLEMIPPEIVEREDLRTDLDALEARLRRASSASSISRGWPCS
jgi:hypothetical protein